MFVLGTPSTCPESYVFDPFAYLINADFYDSAGKEKNAEY